MEPDCGTLPEGLRGFEPFRLCQASGLAGGTDCSLMRSNVKSTKKTLSKLLPLDEETDGQLNRAADLLGIPATAFIRLALHRAFEQLFDIVSQVVEEAAKEYLESKAHGFYKTKTKRGMPKHNPNNRAAYLKFMSRVGSLTVTRNEALQALTRAFRKRTPSHWGPLNFVGFSQEQYLVESILAGKEPVKGLQQQLRDSMAVVFAERFRHHAQAWLGLPRLQEQVAESLMGVPKDLAHDYERDLPRLRKGLECLKAGTTLSQDFLSCLQESAPQLHHHWQRMTPSQRIEQLGRTTELFASRQLLISAHQKRMSRELDRLKADPEFWLNPWALARWLDARHSSKKAMP